MADRPPEAFMRWLEANYRWDQVQSWMMTRAWGTNWQTDPVFQYWAANVSPIAYPTARGIPTKPIQPEAITGQHKAIIENLQNKLQQASDADNATEVELRLNQLVDYGEMTEEDADYYYNSVFPPPSEPEPLTARERQLGLDEAKNAVLWSPWVSEADKQIIKGAEGKALEKKYLAGTPLEGTNKLDARIMDVLANMYNRAQTAEKEYWTTKTEQEAFQAQKEKQFEWPGIPPKPQRPAMPSLREPVKAAIEKTGLGQGTKLRQYLETAFLPGIAQDTAQARRGWWAKMHPEPRLRTPGFMPSMPNVLRGVTENPQELAQMAEDIYNRSTQGGGGHATWYTPPPPSPAPEDPFLKALRERQLKSEYYRLPGTGLVPRLSPSVKFR